MRVINGPESHGHVSPLRLAPTMASAEGVQISTTKVHTAESVIRFLGFPLWQLFDLEYSSSARISSNSESISLG
ncbi:hypothetical protein IAQ61_011621 [Plenodomus lingam]|uniref:uncharacterized protein n=1 Tax=Leptosphaeria maculans TaxID=5022 RepID=UPI0033165235|nr:hypothetical protein IAQ61_011621 [Plenodomus lingam]